MRIGVMAIVATAALAGGLQVQGMGQGDSREPIRLPAMQRDMILAEMRGLLTSVNGVLRGLAAGDSALARESAASAGMSAMMRGAGHGMMGGGRGMGAMEGRGRGMGANLPEGFRTLLHATHEAFDSLAARIAAGAPTDTVVALLASTTGNCLSCHATWRLEVSPP